MKIDDVYRGLNVVQDTGEAGIARKSELTKNSGVQQAEVTGRDAKVEISHTSVMFNKIRSAVEVEDPERVAKVQAIKEQVEKGLYEINSGKVADKILRENISDFFED